MDFSFLMSICIHVRWPTLTSKVEQLLGVTPGHARSTIVGHAKYIRQSLAIQVEGFIVTLYITRHGNEDASRGVEGNDALP